MVKKEIKEIIQKRLDVVSRKKSNELLEKLKLKVLDEIKDIDVMSKKIKQIRKRRDKFDDNISILSREIGVISKKIELKSNGKLACDRWDNDEIHLSERYSGFNVSKEFDKIEEELILSEDESGTLKEILKRISNM